MRLDSQENEEIQNKHQQQEEKETMTKFRGEEDPWKKLDPGRC